MLQAIAKECSQIQSCTENMYTFLWAHHYNHEVSFLIYVYLLIPNVALKSCYKILWSKKKRRNDENNESSMRVDIIVVKVNFFNRQLFFSITVLKRKNSKWQKYFRSPMILWVTRTEAPTFWRGKCVYRIPIECEIIKIFPQKLIF